MENIIILGSGISGISAGYHLSKNELQLFLKKMMIGEGFVGILV